MSMLSYVRSWFPEPLAPDEFFLFILLVGLTALLLVFIPVKLAAKVRRARRARTHLSCRICGYRFLRRDPNCCCPHCGSRNRG